MKVLLIGGGGREHALGWKIAQSPILTKLYLAPGNPGLNAYGDPIGVAARDTAGLVAAARQLAVDLVVVGPEGPLAAGLADALAEAGIACFGPSRAAAQLEASKSFMKEICAEAGVPTAAYGSFGDADAAKAFLRTLAPPFVIKADGLAAGKGVVIASSLAEADQTVDDMIGGRFGAASERIVVEEFLEGEEASFFVISDGVRPLPLIEAQDHKRAFDGDRGPNTGGMGAYSPAPVFTPQARARTMREIIEPTIAAMARRGTPFRGVLFAGLMIRNGAPRLIEFNVRFGDPECQALMRRMDGDILPILVAAARGALPDEPLAFSTDAVAVVVIAAQGYPGAVASTNAPIRGIDAANALPGIVVFQAGVRENDGELYADGGRVLNVTANGRTIRDAVSRAYEGVAAIDWPDGYCRKDIGWRALKELL